MASVTEQMMGRILMGRCELTDEEIDVLTEIDLTVQHRIFCPVTGAIMDSRKAWLVRFTTDDGNHSDLVVGDAKNAEVQTVVAGVVNKLMEQGTSVRYEEFHAAPIYRKMMGR